MMKSIGLFWDIENAGVPTGMTGYAVVEHIRTLALKYGSLKNAKVYLDVVLETARSETYSLSMRSAIQQSGFTVVDCPHDFAKDVADKVGHLMYQI